MRILYLILAGFAGGLLGGMGMGGGTLLIPILTVFLGVNQHLAQWTNVITFLPMSIIALIIHSKNKLVDKKKILPILIPSLLSCGLTAYLSTLTEGVLLRKLFGGFLIVLGVFSLALLIFKKVKEKKGK